MVSRCPVPALILEVPSARVVAANELARQLFPPGEEIIGRVFESFTEDRPTNALQLLVARKLNGYEANRQLRLSDGATVRARIWVRAVGRDTPPRFVLAVVMAGPRPAGVGCPFRGDRRRDRHDRRKPRHRSGEQRCRTLFGLSPGEIIRRPIFRIVHPDDIAALMWALAQSLSDGNGVALEVRVITTSGEGKPCQLLLSPFNPSPSFAFALLVSQAPEGSISADLEASLWHMRRGIQAIGTSRDLAGLRAEVPQLSELSSRELEVVTMLLAGDRVPAIAKSLFVAQSTVRNHLSSVYKKLGIESQQELIDLLRGRKDAVAVGATTTSPPADQASEAAGDAQP